MPSRVPFRRARALAVTFPLILPRLLLAQEPSQPVLLRYAAQDEPLRYEVRIAMETRRVAPTGTTGLWQGSFTMYDSLQLAVQESEAGTLEGDYAPGWYIRWTRGETGIQTGGPPATFESRHTRFEMDGRGELRDMEGVRAFSGEKIFRRLWEVPHVLPEEPVEVGSTWVVNRSFHTSYSISTETEARYEVVEIVGEDVWVDFTCDVLERWSGQLREGSYSGRFGFRPTMGAMVAVQWDYDYRTGNPDRPDVYTEAQMDGSMIKLGGGDELPVMPIPRTIEGNRSNKRLLVIAVGLLSVVAFTVLKVTGG